MWKRLLPDSVWSLLQGKKLQAIAGNAGWLMGDRVLRMGVCLVVSVWLARYWGPETLGIYQYAFAIVAMLSYLTDLGLNGSVVRDLVEARDDQQARILGTTFGAKVTSGVLCIGLAVGIVYVLRPQDMLMQLVVFILAFQLFGRAFDVIDLWFQSRVQSKFTVIAKSMAFLTVALVKVILILLDAPLVAFAGAVVLEITLGAIGLIYFFRKQGRRLSEWAFKLAEVKTLLSR